MTGTPATGRGAARTRSCASGRLACVGALVVAAACAGGESSAPTATTSSITEDGQDLTAGDVRETVDGLCAAEREAAKDPDTARATFYDRSHERLHVIARATERINRGAAASLLMAKERVERDIDGNPSPRALGASLGRLLTATWAALDELGTKSPGCPGRLPD